MKTKTTSWQTNFSWRYRMRFKNKFTHFKKKREREKKNQQKKPTENNQNTVDFYRVRGEMFYNVHHSQIRQGKKTKGRNSTSLHIRTSRRHGSQILTYARYLRPLSSKGSLACHTNCDTGHSYIMVISEDLWQSHLLPSVGSEAVTACYNELGLSRLGFEHPNLPHTRRTL